jgi:hypothetical protein
MVAVGGCVGPPIEMTHGVKVDAARGGPAQDDSAVFEDDGEGSSGASILPKPVRGTWQTEGGDHVEYEYHYDRNALSATLVAGAHLISLSQSGHLVRFDLPEVSFSGQRVSGEPYTAIGAALEGGVLAGRRDGHVYRVDPETLEESPAAKLPSEPTWIQEYMGADEANLSIVAILKYSDFVQEGRPNGTSNPRSMLRTSTETVSSGSVRILASLVAGSVEWTCSLEPCMTIGGRAPTLAR